MLSSGGPKTARELLTLRLALSEGTQLTLLYFSKPVSLVNYASAIAVGAILSQVREDDKEMRLPAKS